jgi:glycosyltransferase involved in cell wall biosynthesis
MRIGLNLLFIVPDKIGGTQIYAESLVYALAKLDRENEYFVFVAQEATDLPLPEAPNFTRVVCPVNAASRVARYLWEQFIFPSWLRRFNIDLVHSLGYVCPLFPSCANVVTIHDINYVGLSYATPHIRRRVIRFFIPASARRADHIITESHFAKKQIVRFVGVPAQKISVIYGAAGMHQSVQTPIEWDDLAMMYGLKTPYVVAFSSQSVHKNIERFLHAFALLKRRCPHLPHDLVLIGLMPPESRLPQVIKKLGLENQVIAPGFVPNEHVFPLLAHGQLFAFPSWYEGFGLPALEAQTAGLPMVCSNAASLPEVVGEGAIYFNPKSIEEMADALQRCLENPQLLAELAANAKENVHRFSWEKTAQITLDIYRETAKNQSRIEVKNLAATSSDLP